MSYQSCTNSDPSRTSDPLAEARLMFGLPPHQQMVKLFNESQTLCYANAGTNALFSAPSFNAFLRHIPPSTKGLLSILKRLSTVQPDEGPKSIQALHQRLLELVPAATFADTKRQQDSAEWITTLLEAITTGLGDLHLPELQREWDDMFRITTVEDLKCKHGHMWSTRETVNVCLQLPVMDHQGSKLYSLLDTLNNYIQTEVVEINCDHGPHCKEKYAMKKTRITRVPKVLIIQLMRFRTTGVKLNHSIGENTNTRIKDSIYKLVGALVHEGTSPNSGHYYTVTRDFKTNVAYICNDADQVQQIQGADLQRSLETAYMLVYQRTDDPMKPVSKKIRITSPSPSPFSNKNITYSSKEEPVLKNIKTTDQSECSSSDESSSITNQSMEHSHSFSAKSDITDTKTVQESNAVNPVECIFCKKPFKKLLGHLRFCKEARRDEEAKKNFEEEITQRYKDNLRLKQKQRKSEIRAKKSPEEKKLEADQNKEYKLKSRAKKSPEEKKNTAKVETIARKKKLGSDIFRIENNRNVAKHRQQVKEARKIGQNPIYQQTKHDNGSTLTEEKATQRRRRDFTMACVEGPNYICSCCHRRLYKNSVTKVKLIKSKIKNNVFCVLGNTPLQRKNER